MKHRPSWFDIFRPLLVGILCRPVLALIVAVIVGVTLFGLGDSFGVPDLFWRDWSENWFTQVLAGVGVGLVFAEISFIGFLLDADDARRRPGPTPRFFLCRWTERLLWRLDRSLMTIVVPMPRGPEARAEAPHWRRLRWRLVLTWLPLLLLVAASAVVYPLVSPNWPPGEPETPRPYVSTGGSVVVPVKGDFCVVFPLWERWPLLIGLAASMVLVAVFLRQFHWFRRHFSLDGLFRLLPSWLQYVLWHDPVRRKNWRRELYPHLLIAFAFGVAVFVPWLFVDTRLRCFLVGLWAATHGVLVFSNHLPARGHPHRWKHVLAGASALAFFLIFETLFVCFWVGGASDWTAAVSPPALVLCLIFGLVVVADGFLLFHFGRQHVLVVGVALLVLTALDALGWTAASLTLPNLDRQYAAPVRLDDTDSPQVLTALNAFESVPGDYDAVARADLHRRADSWSELLRAYHDSQLDGPGDPPPAPPAPAWNEVNADKLRDWAEGLGADLRKAELARLAAWRNRFGAAGPKPKLAVVAVSGGASRSAFWTALVLDRLEHEAALESFPAHVRLMTGASGGMVGASFWAATLTANGHAAAPDFSYGRAAHDCLTPVAQTILFVDLPMAFVPVHRDADRGRALEEAFGRQLAAAFAKPLHDMDRGEREGWRPSLVFSPTLVEDGRRLFISNRYLPFLTENTGRTLSDQIMFSADTAAPAKVAVARPQSKEPAAAPPARGDCSDGAAEDAEDDAYRYSLPGVQFFQLFPDARGFTLGTSARVNASFPYVSPAADLPTESRRRAVDAGYYDDYGVSAAAAWIAHYRRWLECNTSGVVLIQIRDEFSDRDLYVGAGRGAGLGRAFEGLTAPLEGAWNARKSVMDFRDDELVQALSRQFNRERKDMFQTAVFECEEDVAMTWYVSRQSRVQMEGEFPNPAAIQGPADAWTLNNPNGQSLKKLAEWWNEDHSRRRPVAP